MARSLKVSSLAVGLALLGCGSPAPRHSPAVADSNHFRLCELDVHCPGATYCSAGVCDFDCRQDSDCGSGKSCDPRGRCLAPKAMVAPPTFAGKLSLSASQLALTPSSSEGSVQIQNVGSDPIGRYHVISDDPLVSVTPAGGALDPGQAVTLHVAVDPGFQGVSVSVHVLSTGGEADLAILWGSTLAGRLEGSVTVTSPYRLGSAPFAIELSGDPQAMAGAVDGATSLLWPVNAPVSASDDGTNFTATFAIVANAGDPADPLFDVPVRRTVQLSGKHTGPASVAGSYAERIDYGIQGVTFGASGSFELRDVGSATGVKVAEQGGFEPAAAAPSFPPACAQSCTGSDAVSEGECFFQAAFGFEQLQDVTQYDAATDQCLGKDGFEHACFDAGSAACALSSFADAGADGGPAGLFDVWRAEATYGQLAGKAQIAGVLEPVGGAPATNDIRWEIQQLGAALTTLRQGLHGSGGLLSSADFAEAWALKAQAGETLGLDGHPAATVDGGQIGDIARFPGIVASTLYGGSELVDRLLRSADQGPSPTEVAARQVGVGAYLDLAAIGAIFGPDTDPVPELASSFGVVAETFGYAVKGLNAVGYANTYVPFLYNPATPSATVFEQVDGFLKGAGFLSQLEQAEQTLASEGDQWRSQSNQLAQAVSGAAQSAGTQYAELCGNALEMPITCQVDGGTGQIAIDFAQMQAAQQAMQEAQAAQSAATNKLQMLQQQLQEETQDYTDDMVLLVAQQNALTAQAAANAVQAGQAAAAAQAQLTAQQNVDALHYAQQQEQQANMVANCISGVFGAIGSALVGGAAGAPGMPGASCLPLASHLVYGVNGAQQSVDAAQTAAAQDNAQAAQDAVATADDGIASAQATSAYQVEVSIGQWHIQDNTMVAEITDAWNALTAAGYEVYRQTDLFGAAQAKVETDFAELGQLVANWNESQSVIAQQALGDPTYRLYQDAAGLAWSSEMRLVRQWCFLEARAYEYTLDVSDPVEDQCLSASAYQDFNDAFAKMESGAALSGIPQQRRQLISLRSVLGITGPITDPVTGQVLDEGQQFQHLLALPKNRDADGNVRLTFRTSIDPGNPLFSTQVAEDTIQAVEATFVGSQLAGQPGYLTLTQSGNGRLRGQDGSLTSYALGAQTALVETGVNDDLEHDMSLPQNTDLFGRPVDDPGWTLLIDQTDDPSNAQIDVSKLEDIELLILHGAMTIQPQ